jgi:hypothetical protein
MAAPIKVDVLADRYAVISAPSESRRAWVASVIEPAVRWRAGDSPLGHSGSSSRITTQILLSLRRGFHDTYRERHQFPVRFRGGGRGCRLTGDATPAKARSEPVRSPLSPHRRRHAREGAFQARSALSVASQATPGPRSRVPRPFGRPLSPHRRRKCSNNAAWRPSADSCRPTGDGPGRARKGPEGPISRPPTFIKPFATGSTHAR